MKGQHFLRASFTKYMLKRLQKGAFLNIYGGIGTGKSSLLEDIEVDPRKANRSEVKG
jgi:ABC-type lipoprotein export system ATPase subunit